MAKHGASAGSNVVISSSRSHQARQQKKRKVAETAIEKRKERAIFFPLYLYEHRCLGLLFTSSSIRRRGTTVFCVVEIGDENTRFALKMSWQDLERLAEQNAVMERLTRGDDGGEEKPSEGSAGEDHRSEHQPGEGNPRKDNPRKGSPHPNATVPIRYVPRLV